MSCIAGIFRPRNGGPTSWCPAGQTLRIERHQNCRVVSFYGDRGEVRAPIDILGLDTDPAALFSVVEARSPGELACLLDLATEGSDR